MLKEKQITVFYFQVTRSSSYTKKSQFQVEEEDIEKLEIRYILQHIKINSDIAVQADSASYNKSKKLLCNC